MLLMYFSFGFIFLCFMFRICFLFCGLHFPATVEQRKRERENFIQNTRMRSLSIDQVLYQVLADSHSEEKYSTSDDDDQLPSENETLSGSSIKMRQQTFHFLNL